MGDGLQRPNKGGEWSDMLLEAWDGALEMAAWAWRALETTKKQKSTPEAPIEEFEKNELHINNSRTQP